MKLRGLFAVLLCVFLLLSACSPASAPAPGTENPAEPQRASAGTANGGAATDKAGSALHITWMYDIPTPEYVKKQLSVLQDALNKGGWQVELDVLPIQNRRKLRDFATDAYVTPYRGLIQAYGMDYADPDRMLDHGDTVDVVPLCTQYAPLLAQRCGDGLTPSGVPMEDYGNLNQRSMYLMLLQDKAPQQWLSEPPAMSQIVAWLEGGNLSLGSRTSQAASPLPFQLALQAWAGEMGYCPLDIFWTTGGFCVKADDPVFQPVPMESIPGFDDMYRRLTALFKASKYSEFGPCPDDTVGYLRGDHFLPDAFPQYGGIAEEDMVAIPIRGTAWEKPDATRPVGQTLAIPVNSQHAQQVLEMLQWIRTSQEGYDLANYGELDKDYTVKNGRLQWIKGSYMQDIDAVCRIAFDVTMERQTRLTNAADADRLTAYVRLPVLDLSKPGKYDRTQYSSPLEAALGLVRDANAKLVADRENLLKGLLPAAEDGKVQPIASADDGLRQLRELNIEGAADKLAQTYAVELAKWKK